MVGEYQVLEPIYKSTVEGQQKRNLDKTAQTLQKIQQRTPKSLN